MNKGKKFALFFKGFTVAEVQDVLDRCPDDTPVGYMDDEGDPCPVVAVYVSPVPAENFQRFVKRELDYPPPTGDQLEELDFDGAREFARS